MCLGGGPPSSEGGLREGAGAGLTPRFQMQESEQIIVQNQVEHGRAVRKAAKG